MLLKADREVSSGEAIVYCLQTATPINVNSDTEVKKAIQDLTQLKKNIKETVHYNLIQDILMNSKMITLPMVQEYLQEELMIYVISGHKTQV
jgi:hypothetical protein